MDSSEVHYVYDGNLVIQERDANNLPQVTYTRGADLSGKLEGAGGIGGLLARTANPSTISSQPSTSFSTAIFHSDGNGNVMCLVYSNQTIAAKYEYDPYGNLLSKIGMLADANLYRFASKEYHKGSGLIYYLYRYYDPNLQRWINRDPLREQGGFNLFEFVDNEPIGSLNSLGLCNDVCVVSGPGNYGNCLVSITSPQPHFRSYKLSTGHGFFYLELSVVSALPI